MSPSGKNGKEYTPLAERMRPKTLERFYGQEHLIGEDKILTRLIASDHLVSLLFWGPPGSGKTTLGYILADRFDLPCLFFSAVIAGIKEIKESMARAEQHKKLYHQPTIIFLDEIHRFNKAQQGAFLPYVERGDIVLFGSTTENPSFEVIAPLLSRMKVLNLQPLSRETLVQILREALSDRDRGMGAADLKVNDDVLGLIIDYSNGDARRSLNSLEIAASVAAGKELTRDHVTEALQKRILLYDKSGEEHYNLISALHKSLRNSDTDAALYWLARMIVGGEDPLYIARRLVRFASEDVGLADPQALSVTNAAKEAFEFIGIPEGELALAQAVVYLATAPKSNSLYTAFSEAKKDVEQSPFEPVPLHLRNAVTGLMKEIGYGADYRYAHDFAERTTDMTTMPDKLAGRRYYRPGALGFEKEIKKRMDWWADRKRRPGDEKRENEKGEEDTEK